MKITSFNPAIVTQHPEDIIAVFEALGFERQHNNAGVGDKFVTSVTMKSPDGFRVSVTKNDRTPTDRVLIHMNIDDYDEAVEFLESKGFTNISGAVTNDSSFKACNMTAPTGVSFSVVKHIKKD